MNKVENGNHLTVDEIEIKLLLDAIFLKYGYDFRNYSRASIKRRITQHKTIAGYQKLSDLQHQILVEEPAFRKLLHDLSVNVTEMFRDPLFYKKFRTDIVPILQTYPFVRLWVAGCSTGEEVYSLAIILYEEGLRERCQIYATDLNESVLKRAKTGIFPISKIKEYTTNYIQAGGSEQFSDYYTARYDSAIMKKFLKDKIVFSSHNLAIDGVFNEMQVVTCRNVMIYFNRKLQNRVVTLFRDSLCTGGFLCLGKKETMKFLSCEKDFIEIADQERIYRKHKS